MSLSFVFGEIIVSIDYLSLFSCNRVDTAPKIIHVEYFCPSKQGWHTATGKNGNWEAKIAWSFGLFCLTHY